MQVARIKALAESRAVLAETAQSALREAEARKDAFIATLSHELRSPIAPIDSAIQIVWDVWCSNRSRSRRHLISPNVNCAGCNDLWTTCSTRPESGKARSLSAREVAMLADILNDALAAVRPQMEARKHSLKVNAPSEAVAAFTSMPAVLPKLLSMS